MNDFPHLNKNEKELLFKAPAYVSLLAANADGEMDETEKKVAIDLVHVKTYSSKPSLKAYYVEVEKNFEHTIELLDKELPKGKEERNKVINLSLSKMQPIFQKLELNYAKELHKSLVSYKDHVSKAHRNVLASFVIPVYIKGITDL